MADAQQVAPTTQAAKPVPGTPEYEAAMAAKGAGTTINGQPADAGTPPPAAPAAPARPEGLPENFKSVGDLATSYKELQRKLTELTTPKPATPPAAPAAGEQPKAPESKLGIPAEEAVAAAGLDMGALQAEFAQHGDITAESREKLAKSGIPAPMVDAYIAGQKALAAQYDATAFSTAGGEENYGKMVAWAKSGYTAAEQTAFNKAVTSGDAAQMQLAVAGLKARFEANFGTQPNLNGGRSGDQGGDTFQTTRQMVEAMKDPRYKKDPAYRKSVEDKVMRSEALGTVYQR